MNDRDPNASVELLKKNQQMVFWQYFWADGHARSAASVDVRPGQSMGEGTGHFLQRILHDDSGSALARGIFSAFNSKENREILWHSGFASIAMGGSDSRVLLLP